MVLYHLNNSVNEQGMYFSQNKVMKISSITLNNHNLHNSVKSQSSSSVKNVSGFRYRDTSRHTKFGYLNGIIMNGDASVMSIFILKTFKYITNFMRNVPLKNSGFFMVS